MFDSVPTYRMHQVTQSAYRSVREDFSQFVEAGDFQELSYRTHVRQMLNETSFRSSAFQFYTLFPTHFFKTRHVLENTLTLDDMYTWLYYNPYVCIVDIGCGSGAATAAFLETLVYVHDFFETKHPFDVFCLGVDPNAYSIVIYNELLRHLGQSLTEFDIHLEYAWLNGGIPDVTAQLNHLLENKRAEWNIPYLNRVFVLQVNVVSPLNNRYDSLNQQNAILQRYGLQAPIMFHFGDEEAANYRIVFERVPIDYMHIVTVGTDHYMLPQRVQEMAGAIHREFSRSEHKVQLLSPEPQSINVQNPEGSYWQEKNFPSLYRLSHPFHANVCTVVNSELFHDKDWHEVLKLENLKLAWARVRRGLFYESLSDEIELLLFERNLDKNLERLQQQAMVYGKTLLPFGQLTNYEFPKNRNDTRPRGLNRMEEEILSVAIIQVAGEKVSRLRGRSYAYRLSKESDTEYLYEHWRVSHQHYIQDAQHAAENCPQACVLRLDIKSFYTQIVQHRLLELTKEELVLGRRLDWLMHLLIAKEINVQEAGLGIVQGSIGSGFYANIYLAQMDKVFGINNKWGVEFFRYVDDMILVIPDAEDLEEIEHALTDTLAEFDLELNLGKRVLYPSVAAFLEETKYEGHDELLDELDKVFNRVMSPLWIMCQQYRDYYAMHHDDESAMWWTVVKRYQGCLTELGIYITLSDLSRKVRKYLFDARYVHNSTGDSELVFPNLPASTSIQANREWVRDFRELNVEWTGTISELRQRLVTVFNDAESGLAALGEDALAWIERRLRKHLRFAASKLAYLGYGEVYKSMANILTSEPWRIREPVYILEQLSRQGYFETLYSIIANYQESTHPMSEYLIAVCLRALRFLPDGRHLDWATITSYAAQGTLIERLMATETWLYRMPPSPPISEQQISSVVSALQNLSPSANRLRKSYLLLLASYSPDSIELFVRNDEQDAMVQAAVMVIQQGGVGTLFEQQEPSILRRKYYSGRRTDYRGLEYPS